MSGEFEDFIAEIIDTGTEFALNERKKRVTLEYDSSKDTIESVRDKIKDIEDSIGEKANRFFTVSAVKKDNELRFIGSKMRVIGLNLDEDIFDILQEMDRKFSLTGSPTAKDADLLYSKLVWFYE